MCTTDAASTRSACACVVATHETQRHLVAWNGNVSISTLLMRVRYFNHVFSFVKTI